MSTEKRLTKAREAALREYKDPDWTKELWDEIDAIRAENEDLKKTASIGLKFFKEMESCFELQKTDGDPLRHSKGIK